MGKKNRKFLASQSAPMAVNYRVAPVAMFGSMQGAQAPWGNIRWDGDKFTGSFGLTKVFNQIDYWTLRKRSFQIFTENPYALGIVRRIIHNEIHTGLVGDSTPTADVLWPNLDEMAAADEAMKFGDKITQQFRLYGDNPQIFDYKRRMTFGEWQEQVRMESLLSGDGIIVSRINKRTGLPCWEWIRGDFVRTVGSYEAANGNTVIDGVELDGNGRHVAYYVQNVVAGELKTERLPCWGEKSGRRIAWMIYGSEKMSDRVRGMPLLSNLLSMFKEIDRYKDAELRSAVLNALIPFSIQKEYAPNENAALMSAINRAAGNSDATKLSSVIVEDDENARTFGFAEPGTMPRNLQPGEKIVSFQTAHPNVNFATFETAIIDAICWSLEIPPEIVRLKFTSSYSASRQANNEFEIYLKRAVWKNANQICQPIYEEFVIQSALQGFLDLPNFVQICADSSRWREKAAWLDCAWSGISRPSVDPVKDVTAAKAALDAGLTTMEDECKRLNGKSFRQTMHILVREIAYARKLGFTPNFLENNNGQPAYDENGKAIDESEGGKV